MPFTIQQSTRLFLIGVGTHPPLDVLLDLLEGLVGLRDPFHQMNDLDPSGRDQGVGEAAVRHPVQRLAEISAEIEAAFANADAYPAAQPEAIYEHVFAEPTVTLRRQRAAHLGAN